MIDYNLLILAFLTQLADIVNGAMVCLFTTTVTGKCIFNVSCRCVRMAMRYRARKLRIQVGSLYNTSIAIVQVLTMNLTSHVNQTFTYIVLDENGDSTEILHSGEFISIFW
ncbi:hypothetical protein [Microcoleus sp. POL10_C6]|uniref:hypothetical protein n=1 Tax=Microcoleus sp. POL10_C6 TaxID=2818852 RepID=UPI002FD6F77E